MAIDASDRPNDRFGYSVYAGVLLAPRAQADAVARLRERIRPQRAMLPAHVTVMGTFCGIESLDGVKRLFRQVSARHGPVEVKFDGAGLQLFKDSGGLFVEKSAALAGLHKEITAAIGAVSIDAYGYADERYAPHLTLWQECPPENATLAGELGREVKLGAGFRVDAVAFVGRSGPAHGGRWVTIALFALTGRAGR